MLFQILWYNNTSQPQHLFHNVHFLLTEDQDPFNTQSLSNENILSYMLEDPFENTIERDLLSEDDLVYFLILFILLV